MIVRPYRTRQSGFTIIELMIATLVFSMVLVVVTIGVLTFTHAYYKGINQSITQSTARAIMESVAQQIQFSGDQVVAPGLAGPSGSESVCVGDTQYSFVRFKQLPRSGSPTANQSNHVLVVNKGAACAATQAQDVSLSNIPGTEMVQPGMRLAKFDIAQIGTTESFRVTVRVVLGDDDLLCSPSSNDCQESSSTSTNLSKPDLACKDGFHGGQYCAQSELTTVVKQRISH
jgi:prepilin-type N-terminal cleavage/methylation domain-containing protein